MNNQLDFFYGKEAEQFNFIRVLKLLFKENRFKGLSSDSKLLYALLLDRMSLSLKNGWVDNENRVYIYFTVKETMEELNIAKEKCTKIFEELDSEKGCGLIVKVRQGLCRPDVIYVMNFLSCDSFDNNDTEYNDDQNEDEEIENTAPEVENSRSSKNEIPEVRESKSNKNDFNNNKNNNTDFSDNNPILTMKVLYLSNLAKCCMPLERIRGLHGLQFSTLERT